MFAVYQEAIKYADALGVLDSMVQDLAGSAFVLEQSMRGVSSECSQEEESTGEEKVFDRYGLRAPSCSHSSSSLDAACIRRVLEECSADAGVHDDPQLRAVYEGIDSYSPEELEAFRSDGECKDDGEITGVPLLLTASCSCRRATL